MCGSLVVCLASVSLGSSLGYPTKALPQLRNETNENVYLNEYQGSWFAAIFWIAGIIFCPLGGALSGWLGRRKIILLSTPLVSLGWLLIGVAENQAMLMLGRAVMSSAVSIYLSSIGVYISETVHPSIRASLVILPAFFMAFGLLLVWIIGFFLSWRTTALILMAPPTLLTLLMLPLPETPYWLIEDNCHIGLARRSLEFYRGKAYDVSNELNEIRQKHQSKMDQMTQKSWKGTLRKIFSCAFLKPFSCVGILYFINTMAGFNCLIVYMITIMDEAGSNIDPDLCPVIVGCIRLVFAGM